MPSRKRDEKVIKFALRLHKKNLDEVNKEIDLNLNKKKIILIKSSAVVQFKMFSQKTTEPLSKRTKPLSNHI